ncbi:LacI family DNA-binding transcriptional regulator [Microbacteriaceae bacterium VKM Ac-2854]|nr:LacI family DNA-binding transcriptional regulator [Microbacteriaceae bacterium VKM Ac-2854]
MPGPARPTIYDVAERAGVSKSLVSLVLQGSPRVSDARRAAVQAAIEELHYRPSRAAATLASSRTRSIGTVIDDFRNLWFVDLVRGMHNVLDEPGYHLTIADLQLNAHLGQHPVEGFLATHVEGLVVAAEPTGINDVDGVPTVLVGGRSGSITGADTVANDDVLGARIATRHLIDLGHRRVGHITGEGGSAALRRGSFTETMREAGLEPLVGGSGETTEEEGYRGAAALLDAHPDLTALFASNDVIALGALAALRERGLANPADVSVIGYDDSPLAAARYLDLTTIDDQSAEVGAEAARMLLTRIADPSLPPRGVLIPPHLVTRSSTAPPR